MGKGREETMNILEAKNERIKRSRTQENATSKTKVKGAEDKQYREKVERKNTHSV